MRRAGKTTDGKQTESSATGTSMSEETRSLGSLLEELEGKYGVNLHPLSFSSKDSLMESKSQGSESQLQSSLDNLRLGSWRRFIKQWWWSLPELKEGKPEVFLQLMFSSLTPMQQQRLASFIESFGDGESEASTPPPSSQEEQTPTPAQRVISEGSWQNAFKLLDKTHG